MKYSIEEKDAIYPPNLRFVSRSVKLGRHWNRHIPHSESGSRIVKTNRGTGESFAAIVPKVWTALVPRMASLPGV